MADYSTTTPRMTWVPEDPASQLEIEEIRRHLLLSKTYEAGDVLYASDPNTLSTLKVGLAGESLLIGVDGVPEWATLDPTPVDLLDGIRHQDTVAAAVLAGDLIFGNADPAWDRLPAGTNGFVLTMVGGLPAWAAAGGGGSVAGADTEVQYNDSGAFGASDDWTFDKADLWTFGGVSNDARLVFGSGAAPAIVAGQHLLDMGAVPTAGTPADAGSWFFRADGVGAVAQTTDFGIGRKTTVGHWINYESQLFLYDKGTSTGNVHEFNGSAYTARDSATRFFNVTPAGTAAMTLQQATGQSFGVTVNSHANTVLVIQNTSSPLGWEIKAAGGANVLRLTAADRVQIESDEADGNGTQVFLDAVMNISSGQFAILNVTSPNGSGNTFQHTGGEGMMFRLLPVVNITSGTPDTTYHAIDATHTSLNGTTPRHARWSVGGVDDFRVDAGTGDTYIKGGIEHAGTQAGFFGSTPITQPSVAGARDNPELALANLLTELENLGLIVDNTTVS